MELSHRSESEYRGVCALQGLARVLTLDVARVHVGRVSKPKGLVNQSSCSAFSSLCFLSSLSVL